MTFEAMKTNGRCARTGGAHARPEAVTGPPPLRETRFFQIGMRKCATTALAAFFNHCGIPCVHYDKGRLAHRLRENLARGARPLEGYEHYRAFTNMDYNAADGWIDGFREYRALDAAYGGRFILNTRPLERWVASVMEQDALRPELADAIVLRRFGTTDPQRIAARWRAMREAHHRQVLADIAPERLLVFDVESDPPERLCDFIGVPRRHARHWRVENPTLGPLGSAVSRLVPLPIKKAFPQRLKSAVKRRLRTVR